MQITHNNANKTLDGNSRRITMEVVTDTTVVSLLWDAIDTTVVSLIIHTVDTTVVYRPHDSYIP